VGHENAHHHRDVIRDESIAHLTARKLDYLTLVAALCVVVLIVWQTYGATTLRWLDMTTRILDDSDDLDVIAELAYCYLVLNTQETWVRKAIDRILVTQNANGAWGTKEEMHLDMYDRMHATWTAVTALCHSLSKQAP